MQGRTERPGDGPVLDFERPIVELERKIEELRQLAGGSPELAQELATLQSTVEALQRKIFAELTPWQKVLLSRHPGRPYTLDYVSRFVPGFLELHGDRHFADDAAIVAGFGWLRTAPAGETGEAHAVRGGRVEGGGNGAHRGALPAEMPVLVVGHQKGRTTKENVRRNFGMPRPEGYRKAMRLMQTAARLGRPILTFIDTPGAFPGLDAEERGQAEAIAKSLEVMAGLPVPIVCAVIGEGGSGGALALGVADRILMLENTTYSVISPEGCASILWRNGEKKADAARALRITAPDLMRLGVCDVVVPEARGGAHRDWDVTAENLRAAIVEQLAELTELSPRELLDARYAKFRNMGAFVETPLHAQAR